LDLCPECNELFYRTCDLTCVYSVTDKLSDSFSLIPIYSNHLNPGRNKGTLLKDQNKLLKGPGNLIRYVDVKTETDYRSPEVSEVILESIGFARSEMIKHSKFEDKTFSKIKI